MNTSAPFRVGDKVRCVDFRGIENTFLDAIYTVKDVYISVTGLWYVTINTDLGTPNFWAARFELVESVSAVMDTEDTVDLAADTAVIYSNTVDDEDRRHPSNPHIQEEKDRKALIDYKRKMRNYLYGTSSDDEQET